MAITPSGGLAASQRARMACVQHDVGGFWIKAQHVARVLAMCLDLPQAPAQQRAQQRIATIADRRLGDSGGLVPTPGTRCRNLRQRGNRAVGAILLDQTAQQGRRDGMAMRLAQHFKQPIELRQLRDGLLRASEARRHTTETPCARVLMRNGTSRSTGNHSAP